MDDDRPAARRIADLARASLDRRLIRDAGAPLLVAFSGGGDSLALLIAAKRWADEAGRRLIAVTVDHRLRPAGAAWARWCAKRARRLGVGHRVLLWDGDKPVAGLAAAARAARHTLIARAARAAGARVILMGHTNDDRLEARLMRAAGGSLAEPREWSPSPVWPDGRNVFILRPLIEVGRAEIRLVLAGAGESWIDDPANDDPRQPRARARAALAGGAQAGPARPPPGGACPMKKAAEGPAGDLLILRDDLRRAPASAARAVVGAALLCAAGTSRPPRGDRLDRLIVRLTDETPFVAPLAGARVQAGGGLIHILRETADRRRAGADPAPLPAGVRAVWDGRFEIEAHAPGLAVAALAGLARRLDSAHRQALKRVPAGARPGLPAVIDAAGRVTCPSLLADPRLAVRSLVSSRFAAALGAIHTEAAIGRVAETLATS